MNYKIDIHKLTEVAVRASQEEYCGSIVFKTIKSKKWILDFLHHGGGQMVIEGVSIKTFDFKKYQLIEITDYLSDGKQFIELLLNNPNIEVIEPSYIKNEVDLNEEMEFLFFDDQEISEELKKDTLKIFDNHNVIKSESIYEWGASGMFESYLIGIASSITVEIIAKLIAIGFPSINIQRFKLPTKVRKSIAKEYNINPDNLFLESYLKDENGIIQVSYRTIEFIVNLRIKNDELLELTTQKVDTYLTDKDNTN